MKMRLALSVILLALLTACASTRVLPPATPESQGVSSRALLDFIHALEKEVDSPHSFVLVRHGRTVAQGSWAPFNLHDPHMLYSLSKSFTSTAVGFAVQEGLLSVDDKVLSFFPDDAPTEPGENLKAMRLRDLLTMATGHERDTLGALTGDKEGRWPKAFLALPVQRKPGTHFVYNSGATYMCSAIVQKVTGQTVLEYLQPRLFKPLGIRDPQWETDPSGVNVGGWGLKVTTSDIARFGQLYLQKGRWNGQTLLSESWVTEATASQVPNGNNPQSDWNQGYGYQFWRGRHNAYRGDGAFGQFCIVMPEQDAVLAITAGQADMQFTLNLVWKHLLPAMKDPQPTEDAEAQAALSAKLAGLTHVPPSGLQGSPLAATVSQKKYALHANALGIQSATFDFSRSPARVVFETAAGEQRFELGEGRWVEQVVPFVKLGMPVVATTGLEAVAAAGAWTARDVYTARAWLHETPYRFDLQFVFNPDNGGVTVRQKVHPISNTWTEAHGVAR